MKNVIQMDATKGSKPVALADRSDDQLMLLARGGMNDAFDTIVRRHQQMVLRIAMKYLGNGAAAKDVAQNSFLDLYGALTTYEPQDKFPSFLGRITVNRCRITSRQSRGEQRALCRYSNEPPKNSQLAEEKLLQIEQRKRVERALDKLSPKLREVLILRYVADMSYRDIAQTLDLRLGTVKSRVFSGMEKLHRTLGGGRK